MEEIEETNDNSSFIVDRDIVQIIQIAVPENQYKKVYQKHLGEEKNNYHLHFCVLKLKPIESSELVSILVLANIIVVLILVKYSCAFA